MEYTMTQPCAACPFRRGTPMRLREGRVLEITEMILSMRGGEFPCHKTVEFPDDMDSDDNRDDAYINADLHCAGALIFAEKHETQTQMMRICHRLGLYDPEKLMGNQEVVDSVFDTVEEMTDHLTSPYVKPDQKAKDAAPGAEGTAPAIPGGQTPAEPVRRVPKAKREQRNGNARPVARRRRVV